MTSGLMRACAGGALLAVLAAAGDAAARDYVVNDFTAAPAGSNYRGFQLFGDQLLFSGNADTGERFFSFDGSTVTAYSVPFSSVYTQFDLAGRRFFGASNGMFAFDGSSFEEIKRSDGSSLNAPQNSVTFNAGAVFSTNDSDLRLAVFDGSTVSRMPNTPSGGSFQFILSSLSLADGSLLFSGSASRGTELYHYDGSTLREFDLAGGSSSSTPNFFAEANGEVFFNANSRLTRFSGGSAGSDPDGLILGLTNIRSTTTIGDKVIFNASRSGSTRYFVLDTTLGSNRISELSFNASSFSNATGFRRTHDGALLFGANGNDGADVFVYDGSGVRRFDLGAQSNNRANPNNATIFGDTTVFTADGAHGNQVFIYDGSTISELIVRPDGDAYASNFTVMGDTLFFTAIIGEDPDTFDQISGLYAYDGLTLTQIPVPFPPNGSVSDMIAFGGSLYLSAQGYFFDPDSGFFESYSDFFVVSMESGGGPVPAPASLILLGPAFLALRRRLAT